MEYWGLSRDDLIDLVYQDIQGDETGAHYVCFEGTREEARAKMVAAFATLIDKYLYRANSYGSPWREGDDAP